MTTTNDTPTPDNAPASFNGAAKNPDKPGPIGAALREKYAGRRGFWCAVLPKTNRVVVLREPTEALIMQALDLTDPHMKSGSQGAAMVIAQGYQLRLCLVAVGDQEVSLSDVEGERLEALIDGYERTFLIKALEYLTTPPDDEVKAFLKSLART